MNANLLRSPFVLPEDLLIIPVAELSEQVRGRLGDGGEEFALTRPHAREPSKLIDAAAAALIENFREPRTIVQAVIAYSRKAALDPELTLEDALPLLRQLIGTGLLVSEGADGAKRIDVTLAPGTVVAGCAIIRCIQVLDDSELYQARAPNGEAVALKIARPGHEAVLRPRLERERMALDRLGGIGAPRLLGGGEHDGRPYILLVWIAGADAITATEELRRSGDRSGQRRRLAQIAAAYAAIHGLGVLHGDVHPGNLLIGRDGAVTLLDFGLAEIADAELAPQPRGGVGFFVEPELAARLLGDRSSTPVTRRSEQFAVAALLYFLATTQHYVDFNLQQDEMLRQIRDDPPLPFAERGAEPWPALEAALARGLAKAPAARYPDMAAFGEALAAIPVDAAIPAPAVARRNGADALLASTFDYLDLDGALFRDGLPHGPLSSVNFGAAGIAYALYRIACLRDEPRLLALADAWLTRAARDAPRDDAFVNREMELTPEIVGRVSPYHSESGLHLVQALVETAVGNDAAAVHAVASFIRTIERPCLERDLTLGRCGTVLAADLLLAELPDPGGAMHQALREAGTRRLLELWGEIEPFDPLEQGRDWANLGMAHGWAGLLYTTLRWHVAAGMALPASFETRLAELFACARPRGRGLEWPWRQGAERPDREMTMPGWCNGAAGMVHLACLAHRVLKDERWLEPALGAAWQAWEAGSGPVDLCCGLSGRAHALLELHRSVGDGLWLDRAKVLIDRAVEAAPHMRTPEHPRHSLYKGELGLAVTVAELDSPASASMPLFGEAGR
jgi:serine/threonine-protein kinase